MYRLIRTGPAASYLFLRQDKTLFTATVLLLSSDLRARDVPSSPGFERRTTPIRLLTMTRHRPHCRQPTTDDPSADGSQPLMSVDRPVELRDSTIRS